jgi:hypothetical protein
MNLHLAGFLSLAALVGCTAKDPIDRVVRQEESNPYAFNGPVYPFSLPTNATVEEVVTQAFLHAFPLPIHPGKMEVLTNRDVKIHEETCIAVLVQTSGGQKVVLLRSFMSGTNWLSRIYDQ